MQYLAGVIDIASQMTAAVISLVPLPRPVPKVHLCSGRFENILVAENESPCFVRCIADSNCNHAQSTWHSEVERFICQTPSEPNALISS